MAKENDRVERILNELSNELSCWECWEGSEDYTKCLCQTCQMIVVYDKLAEIAAEKE